CSYRFWASSASSAGSSPGSSGWAAGSCSCRGWCTRGGGRSRRPSPRA
ncbi:MAG: hypothetical protein AVDCRST_MAG55-2540, partial [uncultured Rubrobacteraceae bacterium]